MKKLFFTFCLLTGISGLSIAQIAAEFKFEPDSVSATIPATVVDSFADVEIHSLVANDINIEWQRVVEYITPGCATKVCDLNACYPESFSTKKFWLAANATGPISIHLINNTGSTCQAIVRLDMWNVDNNEAIVPAWFIFNYASVGTGEAVTLPQVSVFPNPATDLVQIDHSEVRSAKMITEDGRQIALYNVNPGEAISVGQHPTGRYFLILMDANDKAIGLARLQKL